VKNSQNFDGFGVGLGLVQELIGLVGGRLEVLQKKPRGSEFKLIVPNKTA
jgi:K+-sensing histidine kinase KdpD